MHIICLNIYAFIILYIYLNILEGISVLVMYDCIIYNHIFILIDTYSY